MKSIRPATAESILGLLHQVQAQRHRRAHGAGLESAVEAVKAYQQKRFMHTHADLLSSPRYGGAARFFLNELYGPRDFSERDTQFARIVPALVRLFPQDIIDTVERLAALHALSEDLDTSMGQALAGPGVDAHRYTEAWRTVGRADDRASQIELMVQLGTALDRLTRKPLLRQSLRMMRGPARAAGLHMLHALLESGFDTFHAMGGAQQFLATVAERERHLAHALFDEAGTPTCAGVDAPAAPDRGLLP